MGPDASATEHLETEVKLAVSDDFTLPELTGSFPDLVLVDAPTLRLEAVYLDTADLSLTRSKVSLRHRSGEGAARWTLKLPTDHHPSGGHQAAGSHEEVGALRRRELSIESEDASVVPSGLASLVTGWTRGDPVAPVVTLRTERRRIILHARDSGDEVGEIDDDTVEVVRDGELSETFREIEVEVNDRATNDVLPTVTAALRFAGASESDGTSKVGRALGAEGAVPPVPLRPVLDGDATTATLVRAALSRGAATLVEVDHAIRLDDDPEAVRRASAAVRRLRAALRDLGPNLDPVAVSDRRDELAWFQTQLGPVRYLDVIGGRVRAGLARLEVADIDGGAPLLDHLASVRELTRSALVLSMDSPRYVSLLRSLVAASTSPPVLDGAADRPASRSARRIARRGVQRLERALAKTRERDGDPSDAQILDLRRRIRQARLGLQLAAPVLPAPSRTLVRALARAQDDLGVLADAVDTERWLRVTAEGFSSPSLSLIVGQLVADQRVAAQAVRVGWRSMTDGITHPVEQYLRR